MLLVKICISFISEIMGIYMYNSDEVRLLSQLIVNCMQHHQSLRGLGFTRGLSQDINLKARSPSSGQRFQISRRLTAAITRPKCHWNLLVAAPKPKCYLSSNVFSVDKVTKRQLLVRMQPLQGKQKVVSCWFSICDAV